MKYYLEDSHTAVAFKYSPEVFIRHYYYYNGKTLSVRKATVATYRRFFKQCSQLNNIIFLSPKLEGEYGLIEELSTDSAMYCEASIAFKYALENNEQLFVILRLEGTSEHNLKVFFLPIDKNHSGLNGMCRQETINQFLSKR